MENKRYYLFGGHDWKEGDPEGVVVAATIELANKGYLYLGVLDSFGFDNDGKLDYLILSSAARRDIGQDKPSTENDESDGRFYTIDGDSLVLKYDQIKTLNIQYLKIEEND